MHADPAPSYIRGPAEQITLDLPADISRALTAWIATQPEPRPDRATAILVALRDVLVGLRYQPYGAWCRTTATALLKRR